MEEWDRRSFSMKKWNCLTKSAQKKLNALKQIGKEIDRILARGKRMVYKLLWRLGRFDI